jgi:hypothetical protein
MNDWDKTYIAGVIAFLTGRDPYSSTQLFASPPWSLFVLTPFFWVPPQLAMIFPLLALFYLSVRQKKKYLLPIVGLSFPFIACSVYGNVDWIVMIGVVIGGPFGTILDTVKPQAGIFAVVAELAKRNTNESRLKLLLPLAVLVLLTVPLLASWWHWMFIIGDMNDGIRNFSLFPFTIPLGLAGLYLTWRRKDPLWGVVASLSFSPYFYIHSLLPLLFLLADRNWKWGLAASLFTWAIVGLIIVGVIPIEL